MCGNRHEAILHPVGGGKHTMRLRKNWWTTIRTWRERRALTQQQASAQMGVSVSSWSQWEAGRKIPTETNRRLIAEVLDLSVEHIWRSGEEILHNDSLGK
jgi:transcriptional regulator with XRE-family HTH domain